MKNILIVIFWFFTINAKSQTDSGSVELKTQWIYNVSFQLRDLALCYDFFADRPQLLQVAKQKVKAQGSLTDSTVITFDSLRIEVILNLEQFIRNRVPYSKNFIRLENSIRKNSEVDAYFNTMDDRYLKSLISRGKVRYNQ